MKKKNLEENKIIKDILFENEVKNNKRACVVSLIIFILISIIYFTPSFVEGVDTLFTNTIYFSVSITSILFIVVCIIFGGRKTWIKYLFILSFILFSSAFLRTAEVGVCLLFMIIPLAYSCLYYSKKLTLFVGVLTTIIFLFNMFYNICAGASLYHDLNYIVFTEPTSVVLQGNLYDQLGRFNIETEPYLHNMLIYLIVPVTILYIIIINICLFIVDKEEDMIYEHAIRLEKESSQKKELELASTIQASMLPYDDIEANKNVYAFIKPAREVGGDFYDCFMIDDSHLALIIADVSDKGIPAALLMSRCKTLINIYARLAIGASASFNEVNKKLCQNNISNMFVTAFIGIVDLEKRKMEYVNAGHCVPIIKRKNGKYEYMDIPADLFLGGMIDEEYHEYTTEFDIDDSILLYTDGVTEAEGPNDLYGKERLLNHLNNNLDKNRKELVDCVLDDIEEFANGIEQTDDITMLWYKMEE